MRLWHKDLIPYLPHQQLLGQWRECCLIAQTIDKRNTPNHIIVNRIMDYPLDHFLKYGGKVYQEGRNRGYDFDPAKFSALFPNRMLTMVNVGDDELFSNWHNERYLKQCLYNLQEKYDCGGIPEEEWVVIAHTFRDYFFSPLETDSVW